MAKAEEGHGKKKIRLAGTQREKQEESNGIGIDE